MKLRISIFSVKYKYKLKNGYKNQIFDIFDKKFKTQYQILIKIKKVIYFKMMLNNWYLYIFYILGEIKMKDPSNKRNSKLIESLEKCIENFD